MKESEHKTLPREIHTVDYGGFWDFNSDGRYGPSLLNMEENPNAEQLAEEVVRRYNAFSPVTQSIDRFNKIIDNIECRCMAVDGPVTPTLQEMKEDELAAIWRELNDIRKVLTPQP